jgi:soluble lytic murein transglycosylase-like protein
MNHLRALVLIACAGLLGTVASAEVERLQPDFTFKRVAVPTGATTSRITVQIDPNAPRLDPVYAQPEVAVAPQIDLPPLPSGLDWFWFAMSPDLSAQSPGRFTQALEFIANPPVGESIPAPRLQTLQGIVDAHGLEILRQTVGTRVSPALALAVISVESAGRETAVSSAGAQGLMQLMPATAARFGVTESFDPRQNISGGVAYLDWLLGQFGNDPLLALAGYNAGEGNVQRYNGVPPFAETRAYVPKVLAAWQVARALCRTPPDLFSDPCVFNTSGI